MKKKLLLISLLFTLVSCGQKTNDNVVKNKSRMDNNDILDNDPNLKKLKNYKYEPEYQIEVESYYSYEIRVNDMPLAVQSPPFTKSMLFLANSSILQSGIQSLTITIKPRYNSEETEQKEFLEDPEHIDFKLKVQKTAWVNGILEEPEIILTYKLSDEKIKDITEQKKIHKELSFNATVPFKLKGWTNSKVFDLKDSIALEKKVFQKYAEYRQLMLDRKGDVIIRSSLNQRYELMQSFYFKREKVIQNRKKYLKEFSNENFTMAEILDYKLVFYGNNRVLGLVFNDEIEQGQSCLNQITVDENDNLNLSYIKYLVHLPEGSTELEQIR
ncbi:hypothetical protein Celal_3719 [Cellulophaga algicola DSM 14237]|uniref:Lipoprotein n=1 Tax=Cellulophaga algicola (strain DSM 14237 / IC166 / ACAM 630) TaxID=688270 RepID=E6XA13_CELAD|nr:hypothetical protein [Cellulophaga algicola]ADV50974.1 hypothetical protein Celal_3719 [Cellulophaga algicola DSM 14237]